MEEVSLSQRGWGSANKPGGEGAKRGGQVGGEGEGGGKKQGERWGIDASLLSPLPSGVH